MTFLLKRWLDMHLCGGPEVHSGGGLAEIQPQVFRRFVQALPICALNPLCPSLSQHWLCQA